MSVEPTIESQRVYQGRRIAVWVDRVQLPDGRQTRREILEHPNCVVMVALDAEDNVLLVRQYRKAVELELLEAPAGTIEPGEEPLECARRELEEETGFSAREWRDMGGFYASPGYSTEYLHLFLATDLEAGRPRPDADESIEVVRLPLSQVSELIARGEICDAKSVAALLRVWVETELTGESQRRTI